ncbi:MAG: hypothetical protein K8R68_12010 [Bacteroidales bacterium]|nr:hypothetical protein [Bacteroidales bacterium]
MKKSLLILVVLLPLLGLTQEEKKFGIKFHGFVKSDIFFDSRQTVDVREGHFLLYPKNEDLDFDGNDINAVSKFNILSIQTRLKGVITGPDVWGAKTSGLIEGAFFGNIGTDMNGFRLRHAFVKLSWEKTELLVGQFWHPMFVTSCFPGTVSFNTGTPFQPFARNPQIRFTKKFGKFNLIGTALEQVDFVDYGPPVPSPKYLINSGTPELNLRFEYKSDALLIGAGVNYKTLLPRMSITNTYDDTLNIAPITYKSTEKVSGTSYFGYIKYKSKPITIKLYGVLGQMMFSMTNIGGYFETEFVKEKVIVALPGPGHYTQVNNTTNIKYTPTNTMSLWADIHTNGKTWQFGLFGGYSKNLGSKDEIVGVNYSRGSNIDYAYRISPRVIYNNGKFRVAPEIEYTVAAYGTPDEKAIVKDSKEIANLRFLIGVYFFF